MSQGEPGRHLWSPSAREIGLAENPFMALVSQGKKKKKNLSENSPEELVGMHHAATVFPRSAARRRFLGVLVCVSGRNAEALIQKVKMLMTGLVPPLYLGKNESSRGEHAAA